MNLMFPQAGIITSLDVAGAKAKVLLPIFGIETPWIPVAANLLYETQADILELAIERGAIAPPGDSPIEFTSINAQGGSAGKIAWGTLKVGDEVAVIFLNGDINSGRVIARF